MTGLVWMTKIITDPFHDIKLYYRSPALLFRGGLFDYSLAADDGDETDGADVVRL
jgi:hypothetical protein